MQKLKLLLQSNPLRLGVNKFAFYKICVLLLLAVYFYFLAVQFTEADRLIRVPITGLQILVNDWLFNAAVIIFLFSALTCLLMKKSNWPLRLILFVSFFITYAGTQAANLSTSLIYSFFILFSFLSLIPQSEFENPDTTFFNRQLFYALQLMLLIYSISGFHKLYWFSDCLFDSKCFNENSFLTHQFYMVAIRGEFRLPFENFILHLNVPLTNWLYLGLAVFEFITIFSVFHRKWLRCQIIGLFLMHSVVAVFMNIFFMPLAFTYLMFLAFCFEDLPTEPKQKAREN